MSSIGQRERTFSTESPSEVTNLQWKIDNFKEIVHLVQPLNSVELTFDAGQSINVPTKWKLYFGTQHLHRTRKLCIKVFPRFRWKFCTRTTGPLHIYLEMVDSPKDYKQIFVAYEIDIKNANGSTFKHLRFKNPVNFKEDIWGFLDAFGPLSKALPKVLVNGSLVMDIKFKLFSFGKVGSAGSVEKSSGSISQRLLEKSKNLVLDNLQKLFEQGDNSDFKIIMKDGMEFPVHKAILGSQSPVFLAMLASDMKEASHGTVQVDDLSSEAMEIVLKFVYSGSVDENWKEVVEELVYAAEKYSLTLLKEFCDTMLLDAATPENSIDLLKVARKFKLETAEKELRRYTSQNVEKVIDAAIIS